ncbi:MAG: hypothetical protein EOO52_05595 [Gammaproteobacteria bacterium]|nr:MAG: hypothetical protein EOO52_05595 [Gammaproteobacteria bacterium]
MKLKIVFLLLVALMAIVAIKFVSESDDVGYGSATESSSSSSAIKNNNQKESFPLAEASTSAMAQSSDLFSSAANINAMSSSNNLSGNKVNAAPEIANFLHQMDSVKIPTIILPTPERDPNFDYKNAKPEELREKALLHDPYAAYLYAEYIVKSGVRTTTDTGSFAYNPNKEKRAAAMQNAREFYVRAFRGGIVSAADTISRLYLWGTYGGNKVESLAWRKISFAVGESQRYDCLRNSETCVVKDFNDLNRVELFYPCLTSSGDRCRPEEYNKAMELASLYADSLEFAIQNKVPLTPFF